MTASPKIIKILASFLGVSSFYIVFSSSAHANIVCQSGTIINHFNGRLSSCVLGKNSRTTVVSNNINRSVFPCQAGQFISFDEKGIFQSCTLSEKIEISQAGSVTTCAKGMLVSIAIDGNGRHAIACR